MSSVPLSLQATIGNIFIDISVWLERDLQPKHLHLRLLSHRLHLPKPDDLLRRFLAQLHQYNHASPAMLPIKNAILPRLRTEWSRMLCELCAREGQQNESGNECGAYESNLLDRDG